MPCPVRIPQVDALPSVTPPVEFQYSGSVDVTLVGPVDTTPELLSPSFVRADLIPQVDAAPVVFVLSITGDPVDLSIPAVYATPQVRPVSFTGSAFGTRFKVVARDGDGPQYIEPQRGNL